ncbi:hypothetical protein JGT23_10655 [Enterobacter hormaechei]|uniref:hypothetical protein n=1 Tax=Enterobacter hormaechei TaxID=158836 RepID=UPI0018EB5C40|nr:hypothetical protein [Enterobacter hormaechei]MBJ6408950.1 hypothetical protein [Enterobacter hormaechei]
MITLTKEWLLRTIAELEEERDATPGVVNVDAAMALAAMKLALASLEAEPVSFDDLRDAVAEVSGGPAMEWSDIYKGHQAVPFINFNSLARIVDKFRAAPPATESLTDEQRAMLRDMDDEIVAELEEEERARRAAMLQGAENAESPTAMQTVPDLDSSPKIAELPSGNSLVIPDGYALVPVELTGAMTNAMTDAILDDLHNVDVWRSVLAAAPQQEVK